MQRSLDVFECGLLPYGKALEIQHQLHSEVREGQRFGAIMMLQHQPVLTLGKNADAGLVLTQSESLEAAGIEVFPTDRGGEVTAHEPGQLVVYPILPLQQLRLPPKRYVDRLLESVILTVQHFGIAAQSDPDYPGVWVGRDKICAIGIRVKERVSLHGIALNVVNDLNLFRLIVPCGIRERGVTSLQNLLGSTPDLSDVARIWLQKFSEVMDLSVKIQTVDKVMRNP
ncbi:lipoyl(octanoyl) transferase LipB [Oligoflexus tunisiensis]|uniref:lipoyl(octanoyl) transferase LipB n=1 Tax=Oligoflexus tunisiensis TaxID=708132 RepID=UPI000A69D7BA|nr:lipoyl(octanoyl) transferase LipB [Oligoflexus tunisiensis]